MLRSAGMTGWILPVLLAVSLCGCASGPPGTSYPDRGLVLHTQEPAAEAQVFSQEARGFLEDVGEYLDLQVPPGGLLRIYHYPNRWGLWWHLNREVPSLRWSKGVCYETEEAYVVTLCGNPGRRAFQTTLRHELTHYLVAVHFCEVPPWIDEGLAQVLASGAPFPHLEQDLLKAVRHEVRKRETPGCLRLLAVPPGETLNPSQYRVACALTHYLLTRSPETAPNRLVRYLAAAQPGASPEQTFSTSWGISMEEACEGLVSSMAPGSGVRGRATP